jgi:hypothetical protein
VSALLSDSTFAALPDTLPYVAEHVARPLDSAESFVLVLVCAGLIALAVGVIARSMKREP